MVSFDPVVANAGRLRILAALASEPSAAHEFVALRAVTRLSDGNLVTHARRLESAGLLTTRKHLRAGRTVTTFELTIAGRDALAAHARSILRALEAPALSRPMIAAPEPADDWID